MFSIGYTLDSLYDSSRPPTNHKRVGRGIGSHKGKTCGRGQKGAGSRSGYKRRWGKEGGQMPLYRRLPCRGFSNARFRITYIPLNLGVVELLYHDGEVVNHNTLFEKGFISGGSIPLVKLLAKGTLTKKVSIEVDDYSEAAIAFLTEANIPFSYVQRGHSEEEIISQE